MGEQYKYVIRSPLPWPPLLLTRKKLRLTHTLEPVSFFPLLLLNSYPFSFCLEKIGNPLKLANQKEEEEEDEKKKATSLALFSRAWMSSSSEWTFSSRLGRHSKEFRLLARQSLRLDDVLHHYNYYTSSSSSSSLTRMAAKQPTQYDCNSTLVSTLTFGTDRMGWSYSGVRLLPIPNAHRKDGRNVLVIPMHTHTWLLCR